MLRIQDRYFIHPSLTLDGALKFGVASIVGTVMVMGGTILMVEFAGMPYWAGTAISGFAAFGIKFVMSALWAFAK